MGEGEGVSLTRLVDSSRAIQSVVATHGQLASDNLQLPFQTICKARTRDCYTGFLPATLHVRSKLRVRAAPATVFATQYVRRSKAAPFSGTYSGIHVGAEPRTRAVFTRF